MPNLFSSVSVFEKEAYRDILAKDAFALDNAAAKAMLIGGLKGKVWFAWLFGCFVDLDAKIQRAVDIAFATLKTHSERFGLPLVVNQQFKDKVSVESLASRRSYAEKLNQVFQRWSNPPKMSAEEKFKRNVRNCSLDLDYLPNKLRNEPRFDVVDNKKHFTVFYDNDYKRIRGKITIGSKIFVQPSNVDLRELEKAAILEAETKRGRPLDRTNEEDEPELEAIAHTLRAKQREGMLARRNDMIEELKEISGDNELLFLVGEILASNDGPDCAIVTDCSWHLSHEFQVQLGDRDVKIEKAGDGIKVTYDMVLNLVPMRGGNAIARERIRRCCEFSTVDGELIQKLVEPDNLAQRIADRGDA